MNTNKTIIVTGVSSGLGKALFDALQGTDARLVCISRTFLDYQTKRAGENVVLLTCDLGNLDEVSTLTQTLDERLVDARDVTYIDNAATVAPVGLIGELDEAAIIAAAHTNFVSPMLITNALCALKSVARLTLIYVSTGAARTPFVGWPLYCSTKAGAKMWYGVLQEQYKDNDRVVVHEFDPGVMDTPMQSHIRQSSERDFPRVETFKALEKMQKLVDPARVAQKIIEQYIRI